MKYDEELYLDSGIYNGDCDDEMKCHKEKIIKCRNGHKCVSCGKDIKVGDQVLYETGFMDNHPVSAYTCLPCIENWLEESGQVDSDDPED